MSLAEEHVREFVRSLVRAGLAENAQVQAEAMLAIRSELPDRAEEAEALTKAWLAEFHTELAEEQRGWPERTDYDRLQDVFRDIEAADVVVLQGCEDHWVAKAELERREAYGGLPRGIAWFTPPDVWHAIDEGMLEVNLWHGSTANAAPGDPLLEEVVAVFERHGLPAHFDEGRIEVSAHWHRRPGSTIES